MNMMNNQNWQDSVSQFKKQYYCKKTAMFFFNALYLLAGLGMCIVSFNLEFKVFVKLLEEGGMIASLAAFSLEASKLGTIVVYDFIDKNQLNLNPDVSVWATLKSWTQCLFKRSFQLALFTLSILCVATVVSEKFDQPQLEEIRSKDLGVLEADYKNKRLEITGRQQQEKTDLLQKHKNERSAIDNRYAPLITAETQGMAKERHRPGRRGEVRGPVYESHREMLNQYMAEQRAALDVQIASETRELNEQTQRHASELEDFRTTYDQDRSNLQHQTYPDDPRVVHKSIKAVVETLNHVLLTLGYQQKLLPIDFVALFSLLFAAIIESAIFLSFSSFVKAIYPQDLITVEHELDAAQKKTTQPGYAPESISRS